MGGPNNLDEVKVFLHNMFNDSRIIAAPQPIRAGISKYIISQRLEFAKENYRAIGGKSPIVKYTQELVDDLAKKVDASVHMVMRYTPPFAYDVMSELVDSDEIYAIPLYPQHSSTTTLSSDDDIFRVAKKLGIKSEIKTLDSYQTHPLYISSMVERIKEAMDGDDAGEFELLFSAHGLPMNIVNAGDMYQSHIIESVDATKKALQKAGVNFAKIHLAYQSRLGPIEWLRPYMDDTLKEFGGKKVLVYPIAFTVDNSESEFELAIEYKEIANEVGIVDYRVAKAPNNHPHFVDCLVDIYDGMKNAKN
jgi:ferrochelatase